MQVFPRSLNRFRTPIKRIGIVLAEFLTGVALGYGIRQVILKCALYLAGQHGPDATLYFTMGNAIRNGLAIYSDVFDPKPPAIFLLSAASFALFNAGTLAFILNAVILVCIPILFLWWGIVHLEKKKGAPIPGRVRSQEWLLPSSGFFLIQFSLLIGLTLALYHATIGGDVQTEFYGAFFGLLWLFAAARDRRRPGTVNVIVASLSFALALLFKEPFVLTLFACAILILQTPREWIRLFLIPLLIAALIYVVTLTSLGALGSYVTIYLRSIFGNYIGSGGGPFWARGLIAWEREFLNVRDFTEWFPLLILALLLGSLPAMTRRAKVLGTACTGLGFAVLLLVRSFFPAQFPGNPGTLPAIALLVVALTAFCLSFRPAAFRNLLRAAWKHALAVYITITAIALGSAFHGQYFALALPVYGAFFLLFLDHKAPGTATQGRGPGTILACTALAAAVLLTSRAFLASGTTLAGAVAEIRGAETANRDAAVRLDAILDACDIDRYYFLEDRGYMPYAEHSPLNEYLYTRIEHISRLHPVFFDESFRRLGEARVIVLSKPYAPAPKAGNAQEACIGESVKTFLRSAFTLRAWGCGASLPRPEGYTIFWRKDPRDTSFPAFESPACRR